MSISINQIMVGGNLTRDIDLRETKSGTAVANVGLAVNDRKKVNNEWVEEPIFWDITMFGKLAERCAKHLKKGDSVFFTGRVQDDKWEGDDGPRSKRIIVALDAEFLKWGRDSQPGGNTSVGSPQTSDAKTTAPF